ncbi:AraC family transcriptional regulator [Bacillus sp. JJ722]|uniref:AraC family transcriptional regulator n=1 Tax=Bacillus sp. JJ722 TaxID=3122973 RepID=UPI003000769D
MKKTEQIQGVLDYIDQHIKEEITASQLAELAHYSTYHFYKVFQQIVGYSVMGYVLKRKLQYALYEIGQGEKIITVALEYGFETHAGFTKAFKRCFGSPPHLYRMHCPLSRPQRLDLQSLQNKKTGGIVMQPKIVVREAFSVAGMLFDNPIHDVTYTRDLPAFWSQRGLTDGSVETRLYATLHPVKHGEYCINIKSSEDRFFYLFAVDLEEHVHVPSDMTKLTIPKATYAVFTTPLVPVQSFVDSIQGTWRYIIEEWLPHSPYEINEDTFDFEYYDEYCHDWDYDQIYMEIHLPINQKEADN